MLGELIIACDRDPRQRSALLRTAMWIGYLLAGMGAVRLDCVGANLRVVTYNIDADTGGADGALGGVYAGPGLTTVLQAIGKDI